ncbi:MAG: P83/100 family protein, partial [Brevinematales bacterium]
MKKFFFSMVFFLWCAGEVSGLEVDKKELAENARRVDFVNYTGPYTRPQGMEDLRVIGETLALLRQTNRWVFYPDMKYSILRAVDERQTNGFDADIVQLHTNARIFHVRYIQALLSFYLARTFSYQSRENETIAWFIVYYNAAHRGDWAFFQSRYKSVVMSFLSRQKVGLALRYIEWPGKTQIVIPLSQNPLNQSIRLDTLALGDEKTIESLRQQPDKGIEKREQLVEIQKEQVKEEEKIIQEAKKEVSEEKKEIARQKEEITKKEAEIQQKEKEVAQKKQETSALPPGPEKEKAKAEVAKKEEE